MNTANTTVLGRVTNGPIFNLLTNKSLIAVFDQGVVSVIGFATNVLLARYGQPGELANYTLALSVIIVFRSVQERIISTPYTVFRSRFRDERLHQFAGNALLQQLSLTTLFTVGALVIWGANSSHPLASLIMVLSWVGPCLVYREFKRQYLYSHGRVVYVTILDTCSTIAQLAAIFWLIRNDALTAKNAYLALGIPCLAACLFFQLANLRRFSVSLKTFVPDALMTWGYGRWLLAGRMAGTVGRQIIPWALLFFVSKASVEHLAVCSTLTGFSFIFLTGWNNHLRPLFVGTYANQGLEHLRILQRRSLLAATIVLGLLCLVYLAAAHLIIPWIFKTNLPSANMVTFLLGLHVLATGITMIHGNVLAAFENSAPNFRAELALSVALAISTIAFVPLWGVAGAALATAIGALTGMLVMWHYANRQLATASEYKPKSGCSV